MQSPEHEGNQTTDDVRSVNVEASKTSARAATLLRLNGLGSRSRANGLRLKNGDVVVAVNGQMFNGNENDLIEALTLEDADARALVTISRGAVLFDVLTAGPLGGSYEFTEAELANDISQAFETYQVDAIERYEPFEVMRNATRDCLVFSATPNQLPYVFPAVWLLQNRIWEPMFAVIAAYEFSIVVHPLLFVLIYVLTCVYFGRGQVGILRSYALFHEHTLWLCVAARSLEQAQAICRQIDPRCDFRFSHVGPPAPPETEDENEVSE